MLELILGRAGTGKTTLLRKRLAESTAPKTILIVPEQYTFESERALLMEYGAETANRVQVYSFTRLAQAAFLQYGGGAGKRLTDGGRRILMTLALENCADQLTLFEKSADIAQHVHVVRAVTEHENFIVSYPVMRRHRRNTDLLATVLMNNIVAIGNCVRILNML